MNRPLALLATVLLASGCVQPGAVTPTLSDSERLIGDWQGPLHGPGSGRTGTIMLHFTRGTDSAYAEVVFRPSSSRPSNAILRVSFGWCGGTEVTGISEPYLNPADRTRSVLFFEGRLEGSTLVGIVSRLLPDRSRVVEGTWSATRPRSPHS